MLALASQKLGALVSRILPLEDQDAAAAHAREFGVRGEDLVDASAKLGPLGDGL